MKLISWSFAVLGLWIFLTGIIGMVNWVSIICGAAIFILSLIAALRKE